MQDNVLRVSIKDYKKAIEELQTDLLNLERGTEEYRKTSEELINTKKRLSDAMRGEDSQTKALDGSYRALQEELSKLTKENKNLADAFGENSDIFRQNAERINEINQRLKEADAQMGYFNRNVGEYKNQFLSAFQEMGNGPVGFVNGIQNIQEQVKGLTTKFGGLKGALSAGVQGFKQLTVASLRFIATPIGAAITAIASAFLLLKKGISSTEENQNKFNKIMSRFKPVMDLVQRAIEAFADAVLKVLDPITKFIADSKLLEATVTLLLAPLKGTALILEKVGEALDFAHKKIQPLIDGFNKLIASLKNSKIAQMLGLSDVISEIEEVKNLEEQIAIQREFNAKNERKVIEYNAKEEKKAADLREKAFDTEKYNAKERKKYIQEYHKHQQQIIKNNLTLAKQQLNLAELEAKKSGNTAETNKQLAQQRAEVVKLQAALSNDATQMEKELKKINSEITKKDKSSSQDIYMKKLEWEKDLYEKRLDNSKGNLTEEIKNAKKLEETEYKINKRKIEKEVSDRQMRNALIEELETKHQQNLQNIGNKTNKAISDELTEQIQQLEELTKYAHKYSAEYDSIRKTTLSLKESLFDFQSVMKFSDVIGMNIKDADTILKQNESILDKYLDKLFDYYKKKLKDGYRKANSTVFDERLFSKEYVSNMEQQLERQVTQETNTLMAQFKERFLEARKKNKDLGVYDFFMSEIEYATNAIRNKFEENEKAYAQHLKTLEQIQQETKDWYRNENEGKYYNELSVFFKDITGLRIELFDRQKEQFEKLQEEESKESKLYYADLRRQAETNANEYKAIYNKQYADSAEYYKKAYEIAYKYYLALRERGKKYGEDEEVYEQRMLENKKQWYALLMTYDEKARQEAFEREQKEYEARVNSNLNVKKINPFEIGDTELEEARLSYEIAQAMLEEALQGQYETEKEWQERILALQKDARDKQKRYFKERVNMMLDFADSIGNLTSAIGDYYMDEAQRRKDAAESNENLSEEEKEREMAYAKEAFERGKALQLVTTTISTLAGASGAFMRAVETYPAPYGAILGGIESAAALASGIATIKQIEAQRFDGKSGSSTLGSDQGAMATTFANAVPLIDETADLNSMERDTAVNQASQKDQRVYILQSDITKSEKQVEVRQSQSTFN
jgi:hypothetical protein